tara:strand:- start:11 stop:424 length:414 start_codon:yes stop_codon:yes gene_type:complete
LSKLLSIALSFILLVSQLGVSFATHYCGRKAVTSKVSIGTIILSCGMEQSHTDCSSSESTQDFNTESCCKNELISLALAETVSDSIIEWTSLSKVAPHMGHRALSWVQESMPLNTSSLERVPDIRHNYPLLYQVYTI